MVVTNECEITFPLACFWCHVSCHLHHCWSSDVMLACSIQTFGFASLNFHVLIGLVARLLDKSKRLSHICCHTFCPSPTYRVTLELCLVTSGTFLS